jgi:uncharacterized membrane protein YtjA (UPF0391 family)
MLSLAVALKFGFIGFAGLAGASSDLTKGLFVVCMAAFVACMLGETRGRV